MFVLLRRYLRRVDALYLALCGVFGGQRGGAGLHRADTARLQQQGVGAAHCKFSGHYAGGHFLHGGLSPWPAPGRCMPRRRGLLLPTLFLHNFRRGSSPSGTMRADLQLQLVSGGRHDFQPARANKDRFILNAGAACKPGAAGESAQNLLLFVVADIGQSTALIHIQGHDGTALVFLGIGVFMLYAGGLSNWVAGGHWRAGAVGGGALPKPRPGIKKATSSRHFGGHHAR